MKRNRIRYFLISSVVCICGISSRKFPEIIPNWITIWLGDFLWTCLVYLILALLFHKRNPLFIARSAWIFSICIECSQLYHAAWLDAIRATQLGGLLLGFGFLWSDIMAYTAAVIVCYFFETYSKHNPQ